MTDLSAIYPLKEAGPVTFAEPSSDAPLGDIFTAAERAQRLGGNIVSEAAAREEAYDRRIDAVRQVTGVTLENPERAGYALEARGHLREDMRNGNLSPIDESAGVAPYRRRVFDQKVAELQAKHPELEFGGIDEEARTLGAEAQQNLARATDQPGNSIAKWAAGTAGGMWGSRRDPLFLGTLFAGPSMAIGRTALAKIATQSLGLGVFNAGLTGGEQYAIQDWLAKTGQPTGIGPAAQEVGGAFVGGVGLGVVGGALGEALKAAFKTAWPSAARLLRGQPEPGDVKTATEALAPKPAPPAMASEDIVAGAQSAAERAPPGRQMFDSDNQPMPGKHSIPISDGDKEVGYLEYAIRDGGVNVRGSTIAEDFQGKGLGVAAYKQLADWALANGMELHSMGQTSAQAKNVYEALARRGYTVEKEDGAFKITKGPQATQSLPERSMRAGEDSLAADKATLMKPLEPAASPSHDDLVAAALKRADNPEAPSPEAVAAIERPAATIDDALDPALQKVRSMGSPMDIALQWNKDPEGTFDRINEVIEEISKAEKSLRERHGVRKTEDLEDSNLSKAERDFLFHGADHTDRDYWKDLRAQLQPVKSLGNASTEIAYELKRLPQDVSNLSPSDEIVLARLQVLFSEVERLGGNVQDVLRQSAKKYASRFSDPEDAIFMVQNAAERLRGLFEQSKSESPALPSPSPELAARIEQANPRNPREAMAAADQALDDFGRRDGMAALQEQIRALKEARDTETAEWRGDETRERPGDEDIRNMVPMKDRHGNDVMRSERAVRSDGDVEQGTADLIRECK